MHLFITSTKKVPSVLVLDYRTILVTLMIIIISVTHIKCVQEKKRPTALEAKVGSYATFNCPIEFPQDTPIPYTLQWNKDGDNIFIWYDGILRPSSLFLGRFSLLDKIHGYGKASINLTSIRESDQGWYECKVFFPTRTPNATNNGTWFYLSVESGSLIKIPPINQTIMEGKTAFFNCLLKKPETSTITWYKDGTELSELTDLLHRAIISQDGSLSIDPTMMSDLGEYECVVKNNDGETQTARSYLNIQYKAKVVYSPPEVYLPYGQEAVLDCHFRSNPPLTNLRWEKDGFLFDPYNNQGVYYKPNGSIVYKHVDESHAGRYTCTPFNELGTDGPSPIINVIVQRPPIFTLKPKSIYVHKLTEDAHFPCDAIDQDGNHRPLILWSRKDGIPLPAGRYILDGGNLTLENINEADRGIYQCTATNEAATITADSELMIENIPPRPPYNLTANSSETSITIRWQPGYIRPNLEYIVWYRLSSAAEWRTMRLQSRNVMEATINNLQPEHEYEFMVLSQDRYGDGMFSKSFRYSTKQKDFDDSNILAEPIEAFNIIGPPRNLTITHRPDGYMATWESPDYGLDSLCLYIVKWYLEPGHNLHGSVETRDNHYVVQHLKEGELYTFQVFTLSTGNYQAGSNEIEVLVPSHRKMRAVAIGCTVVVLFLITAVSVFIYVKKSCRRQVKSNGEKIGP